MIQVGPGLGPHITPVKPLRPEESAWGDKNAFGIGGGHGQGRTNPPIYGCRFGAGPPPSSTP